VLDRLIELLLECIGLLKFWHVIDPYEEALVLRLGKLNRHLQPGFNWVAPFGVERVYDEHVVPTTHSLGNESVTTKDGRSIGFHAIVTYRVRDIEKLLLEVEDGNHAVRDACSGEIGRVLRESTWEEICQADILDKLTAAGRKRGFKFGVEIMSVQLAGMALCRSIRLMQSGSAV
jgi:modulator of FtsH protease HflK